MKIVPSLLVESMHGSYSGGVIRRSRWGLVGQKKAHVSKRGNNNQSRYRSNFQAIAGKWKNLAEPEKERWKDIAEFQPIYSKKNELKIVPAYNFAMHVWGSQATARLPLVDGFSYSSYVPPILEFYVQPASPISLHVYFETSGSTTGSKVYFGFVRVAYKSAPVFNNGLFNGNIANPITSTQWLKEVQVDFMDDYMNGLIQCYARVVYDYGGISPWLLLERFF